MKKPLPFHYHFSLSNGGSMTGCASTYALAMKAAKAAAPGKYCPPCMGAYRVGPITIMEVTAT